MHGTALAQWHSLQVCCRLPCRLTIEPSPSLRLRPSQREFLTHEPELKLNPQDAVDLGREAMTECLMIGSPILIAGLVIGLIIGMLQAMTQVHDQTVAFVPKVLGMCVLIALALPWLAERMIDYTRQSLENPVINVNMDQPTCNSQNGFAPVRRISEPAANSPGDAVATRISFLRPAEFQDDSGPDERDESMPVLHADNVAESMPVMSSRFENSMPVLRR